jgi:uncharacterized membrane protein (DUF485 family)
MTALDIAIAVVALLVVLTAIWSWRAGGSSSSQLHRRRDVRGPTEERDLL